MVVEIDPPAEAGLYDYVVDVEIVATDLSLWGMGVEREERALMLKLNVP